MTTNKWDKLHETFLGNMYPSMYEWLASDLKVTVQVLQDLQVGWVPVMPAKEGGWNTTGYFSFPMRDSTAKIIGLSLRPREGKKLVWPGSSLGCFYVVNKQHRLGEHGYSSGAHNWRRTMDARVLCPICGKPDGCLVSAENPDDPRAVVCRKEQSPVEMKFGWLHIRKAEGILSAAAPLNGTGRVLVVEGASDVAAATDLGYVAVGKPNNLLGSHIVSALVRGRPAVIMGENDKKTEQDWPGRDGMIKTFSQLMKDGLPHITMLMPPVKDLRQWKNNGLTAEEFEAYVAAHETKAVEDMVLKDNQPMTVAEVFLRERKTVDRRIIVKRWGLDWFEYSEGQGRYVKFPNEKMMAEFMHWARDKAYNVMNPGPQSPPVKALVGTLGEWQNFEAAVVSHTRVPDDNQVPVWLNGAVGPTGTDVIAFRNGIYDVAGNTLLPTTPDFFNVVAIPYNYNPVAHCDAWLEFLDSSLGDDPSKIALLQEWFGYCMTPDTSLQKFMYLLGVTRSGKGTILRVMERLVGSDMVASANLASLSDSFGAHKMMDKLICLIGDARLDKSNSIMRGLETILNITGGDSVPVNRKHKDELASVKLPCKLTIASNEYLALPDHNGALHGRLNVITFSRSFLGKEDYSLDGRLAEEREGIAVWAIEGLNRLRHNGRFSVPKSSQEAMIEWKRETNDLSDWIEECLVVNPQGEVPMRMIHDCYNNWAKKHGMTLHKTSRLRDRKSVV